MAVRIIAAERRNGFSSTLCKLYSVTRGQEALRQLFRGKRDFAGNLPSLPAVYPDTMAPVIRRGISTLQGLSGSKTGRQKS